MKATKQTHWDDNIFDNSKISDELLKCYLYSEVKERRIPCLDQKTQLQMIFVKDFIRKSKGMKHNQF